MKCVNCKKKITAGYLWGRMGETYTGIGHDLEGKPVSIEKQEIKRIFGFCSKECQNAFWLSDERMNKFDFFKKRLVIKEEVAKEIDQLFGEDNATSCQLKEKV